MFLVFYRHFENALGKIWLNIGIFGKMKSVWYMVSVVAIPMVLVWFRFVIFLKMAPLLRMHDGVKHIRYLTKQNQQCQRLPMTYRKSSFDSQRPYNLPSPHVDLFLQRPHP